MGSMNMTDDTQIQAIPDTNSTCELFDGDQKKCDTLNLIQIIVGSISLIACLFILFLQWLYRKYKIFVQRLILCLTLASLWGCIIKIMGDEPMNHHHFCIFQGWGMLFGSWTSLSWVIAITFNLYMNAVLEKSTEKLEWLYHVLAWGLSFILTMIPFAGKAYGPAGAWCWIVQSWEWRFGIWYCPYIITILALIGVYTYIIYKVKIKVKTWQGHFDPHTEQQKIMLKQQVMPLRIYPFVYLILAIFPLIDRIHNAITGDALYGLKIMHAIFNPLQGALNALVFCLDKETVDQLQWSQMKIAFQRRLLRVKTEIYEYPAEVDTTPTVGPPGVETGVEEEDKDVEFSLHPSPGADSHI